MGDTADTAGERDEAVIVGYIRREDSRKDMVREEALRDWGAERSFLGKDHQAGVVPAILRGDGCRAGDTSGGQRALPAGGGARGMIARLDRAGVVGGPCTTLRKETLRVITALAEIEERGPPPGEEKVQRAKEAEGCYKGARR